MKFRPCIDIHQGKVKQIIGGTLTDSGARENYVSDRGADHFANMYSEDGFHSWKCFRYIWRQGFEI